MYFFRFQYIYISYEVHCFVGLIYKGLATNDVANRSKKYVHGRAAPADTIRDRPEPTSSVRRPDPRIVNPLTELVVSVRLGSAFGRTRVSRTDGSVADFHPLARSSGRKPTEIVDSTHDPRVPTLLQRTETGPSTHNHWPHMPPGTAQPSTRKLRHRPQVATKPSPRTLCTGTRSSITHRNHTRSLSVQAPVTLNHWPYKPPVASNGGTTTGEEQGEGQVKSEWKAGVGQAKC